MLYSRGKNKRAPHLDLDVSKAPVVGVEECLKCGKVLPLPAHTQVVPLVKPKGGPSQRMP